MQDIFNTFYRDVKYIFDQVGINNPVESTLMKILSNVERIFHTNISQRCQDIQSRIYSCREFCKKIPDWGISIPEGGIVERSIVSIRNFKSSKVPRVSFTDPFGPAACKSDLVWKSKSQIPCR